LDVAFLQTVPDAYALASSDFVDFAHDLQAHANLPIAHAIYPRSQKQNGRHGELLTTEATVRQMIADCAYYNSPDKVQANALVDFMVKQQAFQP
jgi:hypothetical protein